VAEHPVLIFLMHCRARPAPKTADTFPLTFGRRVRNACPSGVFCAMGIGLSYPGLFSVLAIEFPGSDTGGYPPIQI
jgi:hypothetical protein